MHLIAPGGLRRSLFAFVHRRALPAHVSHFRPREIQKTSTRSCPGLRAASRTSGRRCASFPILTWASCPLRRDTSSRRPRVSRGILRGVRRWHPRVRRRSDPAICRWLDPRSRRGRPIPRLARRVSSSPSSVLRDPSCCSWTLLSAPNRPVRRRAAGSAASIQTRAITIRVCRDSVGCFGEGRRLPGVRGQRGVRLLRKLGRHDRGVVQGCVGELRAPRQLSTLGRYRGRLWMAN